MEGLMPVLKRVLLVFLCSIFLVPSVGFARQASRWKKGQTAYVCRDLPFVDPNCKVVILAVTNEQAKVEFMHDCSEYSEGSTKWFYFSALRSSRCPRN